MQAPFGYETEDLFVTARALQLHFRPARVNGRIDFETARRLRALVDLCAGVLGVTVKHLAERRTA